MDAVLYPLGGLAGKGGNLRLFRAARETADAGKTGLLIGLLLAAMAIAHGG
jgi:hypothetical protein